MLSFKQYIIESRPPKFIFDDESRNKAWDMRRSGKSDSDISEKFFGRRNFHSSLRYQIDRPEDKSHPDYVPPIDHRQFNKRNISPEMASKRDDAVRMHRGGEGSFKEIGIKLGVPRGTVARWVMLSKAKPEPKTKPTSVSNIATQTGSKNRPKISPDAPISDIMNMVRISRKE